HIGLPGCTTAPRGDDYSLFHLGTVRTTGGEVAVGTITMNTGHADTRGLSAAQASAHYDNTGTQVAYVRAGEDDFGPWVAGALSPDCTDEDLRRLRAAKLSGDWRPVRGRLTLVAALAVNVPGFPVPRPTQVVASGEPV